MVVPEHDPHGALNTVRKLFTLTGLDRALDLYPSVDAARDRAGTKPPLTGGVAP
jgi:hypothetical protein